MKNKKHIGFIVALGLLFSTNAWSQNFPGCASVSVEADIILEDCSDVILIADAFEVGSTETYEVQSIDYAPPIPFDQPGGTAVSVNIDDTWSPVINLPFDFCFFGETYSTAQVGSNGAISLGTNHCTYAGCHPWSFSSQVPMTSPANVGHIFGVYHDIHPGTSNGGTIKYHLLGEAPCRILAVVIDDLPHFSCTSLRSSSMIVLYETTNVIDVYVKRKDMCSSWNGGRAAIGIQNPAGTVGYTPAGRNTGQWTVQESAPEAWRFQPTGTALPYTIEWLEDGQVIAQGNTVNVAPSVATTYTARATYTSCTGDALVVEDELMVTPTQPNPMIASAVKTDATCHGLADGTITVSATDGEEPYQYYIDGGPLQQSNVFENLPAGIHTIGVQGADGCKKHVFVTITEPETIGLTQSSSDISCHGYDDGTITLSQSGGTPDYEYSLNGGPSQSENVFTNLAPGEYTVIVTDGNGCDDTITKILTEPTAPVGGITSTETVFCQAGTTTITKNGVGNFSSSPTGLILSSISGLINLEGSETGTYDVVFTFTENGCVYKDTLQIQIIGSSDLGLPNVINLCIGESWTPDVQGDDIVWSDGLVNGESVVGQLGSFTYTVSGSIEGCPVEDQVTVTTHNPPTIDFSANPNEGVPPLDVVFTNNSTGATDFVWDFGDGQTEANNDGTVYHTFSNDGVYTTVLTGTSQYGCVSSASTKITVIIPDMTWEFPNIFTPNGDNQNDVFKILDHENVEEFEIVILNRWGNVVFESNELDFEWNGKVKNSGPKCDDGVYFYKATFKNPYNEDKIASGYIHLNGSK